jgi:hypothetical protein
MTYPGKRRNSDVWPCTPSRTVDVLMSLDEELMSLKDVDGRI